MQLLRFLVLTSPTKSTHTLDRTSTLDSLRSAITFACHKCQNVNYETIKKTTTTNVVNQGLFYLMTATSEKGET